VDTMTTTEVSPRVVAAEPSLEPLIEKLPVETMVNIDFDPAKHIDFKPPSKVHTMTDLGFPDGTGVSPCAASEPFQLFTKDAIHQMRAEIMSKEVWDNCQYSSNLAKCQLRGFASK
jgi:hypothetical protein